MAKNTRGQGLRLQDDWGDAFTLGPTTYVLKKNGTVERRSDPERPGVVDQPIGVFAAVVSRACFLRRDAEDSRAAIAALSLILDVMLPAFGPCRPGPGGRCSSHNFTDDQFDAFGGCPVAYATKVAQEINKGRSSDGSK